MTNRPAYDNFEFRERVRRALASYEGAFEIAPAEDAEAGPGAEAGRRELVQRVPGAAGEDARIFEPSAERPVGYPDVPFIPHTRTMVVTQRERRGALIVNWMEPPDPAGLIDRLIRASRDQGWSVASLPDATGANGRIRLRCGEHRTRVIGSWGSPSPEVVWLMQYDAGNGTCTRRFTPRGYAPS
jgi:hypothetical protein